MYRHIPQKRPFGWADVLVIAHHGSKTSSTPNFIQQVAPRFAVISAGFDNRFHFPHEQTLRTMGKFGVRVFSTSNCGMVTVKLPVDADVAAPVCYMLRAHTV